MLNLPRDDEQGQGLVEYVLILVLILVVVVAIFAILGPEINTFISKLTNSLTGR